jgi:thiosulfate/3-mercaptopyruvate sulfurtransferase
MTENPKHYANPQLLIGPQELAGDLEEPSRRPTLLDLRPAELFAQGHLPHAVHLDLFGISLTDTDPGPLKSFLWMIEHLLATRGVSADRPVVVYDSDSGIRAARAFWFLELFGHPNVRLLDGGVRAWTAAGLPLNRESEAPTATSWTGERRAEVLATWRDVADRLDRSDVAILDTRTDGEYCGTTVRAARGGAIPGAIHLEWTRNLGPDGAFKPASELAAMYAEAGITPDREVVSYCQGGYRAAHSYLALRLLGYPRLRSYLGSWKEWGDREDLPIEKPKTRELENSRRMPS